MRNFKNELTAIKKEMALAEGQTLKILAGKFLKTYLEEKLEIVLQNEPNNYAKIEDVCRNINELKALY